MIYEVVFGERRFFTVSVEATCEREAVRKALQEMQGNPELYHVPDSDDFEVEYVKGEDEE